MKKDLLRGLLILTLFSSCKAQPVETAAIKPSGHFAIIELFTSQGCSSCPPADALLGSQIAAAAKKGKNLIALSFHVDYWNRLGWTDPFSQHLFSERQYGYAGKMKLDGVYTPQVVVNGQWQTVGSTQQTIEKFIQQAIAETQAALLIQSITPKATHSLAITYQYKGPAAMLNIAVVQHQVSTPVKAGENGGRTLINYNVVRTLKTITTQTGNQAVEIAIPVDYNTTDYAVVLYAQEKGYGKIVAADMQ